MVNSRQVSDSIIAKYQIIQKEEGGEVQNKRSQGCLQLSQQMADMTFDGVVPYLIMTHQLKVSDALYNLAQTQKHQRNKCQC